jgi:hypothetical protein
MRNAESNHKAVESYRKDLVEGKLPFSVEDVREKLAGLSLACWCPFKLPCHADLLLFVAAGGDPELWESQSNHLPA